MSQPPADQLTDACLLTPHEVAARLRVSSRTVVRLVKGGLVPARAVLGKIRLSWPEVLASLPRASAPAAGRAAAPGVATLDLPTRLRLKATHYYRAQRRSEPTQPGGAA